MEIGESEIFSAVFVFVVFVVVVVVARNVVVFLEVGGDAFFFFLLFVVFACLEVKVFLLGGVRGAVFLLLLLLRLRFEEGLASGSDA